MLHALLARVLLLHRQESAGGEQCPALSCSNVYKGNHHHEMAELRPACIDLTVLSAQTVSAGQPLKGPAMARFQDLAKRTGLWLSLGGFQETGPDPQHIYNTHVILDAEGAIVSSYRKVCTC